MLKNVTAPLRNNKSGGGQLQLGIAKKPTKTDTVVFDGYQEHIVGSEGRYMGMCLWRIVTGDVLVSKL